MANSTSPTRRTVVKGAAWATPALVVASAVPAIAASPEDEDPCGPADVLGWTGQSADVIAWTAAEGKYDSAIPGLKGTGFDVRLGTWQFDPAADPKFADLGVTGYKINWDTGTPIVFRSIDPEVWDKGNGTLAVGASDDAGANEWHGSFSRKPNSGPLVAGAGLVFVGGIQSTVPHTTGCLPNEANRYLLVSIPFEPIYIKGLKEVARPSTNCGGQKFYWNAVMYAGSNCVTYSNQEKKNWVTAGLPEVAPSA